MKNFKVRLWNYAENQMIYPPEQELGEWMITLDGTYVESRDGRFDGVNVIEVSPFTGLKDINKQDIYEGDILQYEFPSTNNKCKTTVGYQNGRFYITIDNKKGHLCKEEIKYFQMKVIGNKFQKGKK